MFDLPEPFGPTMTATPGSSEISTGSGNDLKPRIRSVRRCTEAAFSPLRRTAGRSTARRASAARAQTALGHDAERLERLACRFLLGGLLRRAAADAELLAGDVGRADEAPVVRWALDLEDGVVHLLARPCERLLELRLVVDVARAGVLDPLAERLHDGWLDALEPDLEVHGRDGGLEHGCEDVPAARDPLQLVLRCFARAVEEPVAEAELLRHRGAALARHDVGADLRETPFRGRAETIEHRSRDRKLEDAVAQKFQTLVRRRPIVRPGGVREDLLQFVGGELRDQAAELVHPGRCV